jgi:uracil-DNA glycosylase
VACDWLKLRNLYLEYAQDPAFEHLRVTGANLVPGDGPTWARVMFIGEAPGETEDQMFRPFVGKSGGVLDQWLDHAGTARRQVFVTNTVKYRPPDNRTPTPAEIAASRPYVAREVLLINPKLTVLLGRASLELVFPGYGIGDWHGSVLERRGRKYLVLYHPANWFYQPGKRPEMLADILKIKDYM